MACTGDLFPTKWSFVIFLSYMALFVNQGILVTASKATSNSYAYSTITVVLLTECLKLAVAVILYLKDNNCASLKNDFIKHKTVFAFYFVPAFLYCLYNNLQFTNLAQYDPTTYFLLLQFRVVITGIVFQILFEKKLSSIQWGSLLLLTLGCIVKEWKHTQSLSFGQSTLSSPGFFTRLLSTNILLILLQVFCSVFAGVYNEYLLKNRGCEVHLMMQNMFMYINSIFCNVMYLGFTGELSNTLYFDQISAIFSRFTVLGIMVNSAAIGIITSLFLRNLNSILKTFASALEIMITAVLCWLIFDIPIDVYTGVAIVIVCSAIVIYAQNPIVNRAKNEILEIEKKENGRTKTIATV